MLFENEYTDFLIFNFHNEVLMHNLGLTDAQASLNFKKYKFHPK